MQYTIVGGRLGLDERRKDLIRKEKDNRAKERHFKVIAEEVLASEGFTQIMSPQISQSIPFDFIAIKDRQLSLIEMKGANKDFNVSSDVQFARLFWVVKKLKEKEIKPSLYLLQINLIYGVYQILPQRFYDLIFEGVREILEKEPNTGRRQAIGPSLEVIEGYLQTHVL